MTEINSEKVPFHFLLSLLHILFGGVRVDVFSFFLLCVYTFWVQCCDVRYDFRIKTMFGSLLPPVVCRRPRVLFEWCPIHIVLCFCFVCRRHVYPMLPVYLECPFCYCHFCGWTCANTIKTIICFKPVISHVTLP